jgi:hypothetical protein
VTNSATGQDEIFAFLRSPEAWPSRPDHVDVIETHGALIFMAGYEVVKVKRAIKLPYLDFSTLERRKHFLDRELEVNRPSAPTLYHDVVAITRERSGKLAVGGTGEPVEWGLRMSRFNQDGLLSRVVRREGISASLADRLADTVFRYHQAASHARADRDTFEITAAGVLGVLAKAEDPDIADAVAKFSPAVGVAVARSAEIRARRARAGALRRCHGDLHLGNIVLWRGRPVLFDAIEFDEGLATIDTLYDLAFLLMDLDRNDARPAANGVLNRYLWRSGDLLDVSGLAALPVFLGLRAAIRAMVALDRAKVGAEAAEAVHAHVLATLARARAYLAPPPPRLIAIGGLSGTGKTSLALEIAPGLGAAPGALHLRSDLERKWLAGVEPHQRLAEAAYTIESASAVYTRVLERAEAALRAGHSVVLDAVFADPGERREAEALADRAGVPFEGLWLEGRAELLKGRVAGRSGDASDATPQVVERQLTYDTGEITWTRLDASGTLAGTVAAARQALHIP